LLKKANELPTNRELFSFVVIQVNL